MKIQLTQSLKAENQRLRRELAAWLEWVVVYKGRWDCYAYYYSKCAPEEGAWCLSVGEAGEIHRAAKDAYRAALRLVALGVWKAGPRKQSERYFWPDGKDDAIDADAPHTANGLRTENASLRKELVFWLEWVVYQEGQYENSEKGNGYLIYRELDEQDAARRLVELGEWKSKSIAATSRIIKQMAVFWKKESVKG